jgi:bcr-type benzoyl-CoA reductase subunit C
MEQILAKLEQAATHPLAYARRWKQANARPVVGILPMHFPGELAHAAGALPIVLQEDEEPITVGLGSMFNFYCAYNRSLVDQALRGELDLLDAVLFGDHCVQLLGTADILRQHLPKLPILFNQLCTIMDAKWAPRETQGTFRQLWRELEALVGRTIPPEAVRNSIRLFNRNRALMRELYDLRRSRRIALTGRQMQHVVKSSMVMDKAEHTALLEQLIAAVPRVAPRSGAVRVFLSGHLCHAPKPAVLDLVEECGGVVVDDDLYTGFRFIFADIDEALPPVDAMAEWYLSRNSRLPCPTRAVKGLDWEDYLLDAAVRSGAQGLIILQAKFCEPHMFYYPEIKEAFDERGIPHLLIQTEHEEMPLEALKTRVETFLLLARRQTAA